MKNNTKQILKDLISIDSNCNNSNREIVEYLKKKLNKFEIKEYPFKKGTLTFYNLIVKIPGKNSKNPLVFTGHTDTVPSDESWTINPLEPIEKNGKIYGLGASDMKSGLACMISAVNSLNKKPPQDTYLVFTADEEGEGKGTKDLLRKFCLKNAKIIVAEPSSKEVIYANKGCLDFLIELKGNSCHSSQADFKYCEKYNAINKASEVINKILEYSKEIELKKDKLLGKPTLNIGQINGGVASNKVACSCKIKLCRRLIPCESIEEEFEIIKNIIFSVDKSAKITPLFSVPPFYQNTKCDLSKIINNTCSGIIKNLSFDFQPSTTEAGLFQKMGETLIFGPGNTKQAHRPDEYIKIKEIERFAKIYKNIITNDYKT